MQKVQPEDAEIGRIRRLRPEEWAAYRDLRLGALAESPDAFGSTFEREVGRSDDQWRSRLADASERDLPVVAEVDGQLKGLVWGHIDPEATDRVQVYQMWVAPQLRGRGLGRKLLLAVVEWAGSLGVREVGLCVTEGEHPARRLYESVGFRAVGSPYPLRPESALLAQSMVLDLSAPLPHDERVG